MQALDLTEESLRILWPPESSSLSRTSSFMVNRHPNQRDVAAVTEFGITSTPRKFGPFKSRYACCKIILGGGGKLKAPLLNGSKPEKTQLGLATGRRTSGEANIAAKFEKEIHNGISAEMKMELTTSNMKEVSQKIAVGNWLGAARDLFNIKIKRGIPLTPSAKTRLAIELDFAPDADLCFFSATGKINMAVPIDRISALSLPSRYTVEVEFSVTFRFGLTTEGWTQVAKLVGGGPVIKAATNQIANIAAQRAIKSALTTFGIFSVTVAGTLGLLYVTAEICNSAYETGTRWGLLMGYCTGYLERIRQLHDAAPGTLSRSNTKRFIDGWNDAGRAISATSLDQVERTIIHHFGSNYDIEIFDSIINWDLNVSNVHSRIGNFIDEDHEVTGIALTMSHYMAEEIDKIVAYLGTVRAGGYIRFADQKSERR
ncbi:MAG: hypothetical protein ACI91V_000252 [Lentimonas sp.]|jgi:hypothetical protein